MTTSQDHEQDGAEPYQTEWECQFCGETHDTVEEHKEHVNRLHYAELRREADGEA